MKTFLSKLREFGVAVRENWTALKPETRKLATYVAVFTVAGFVFGYWAG